jgi:hypothetical protein
MWVYQAAVVTLTIDPDACLVLRVVSRTPTLGQYQMMRTEKQCSQSILWQEGVSRFLAILKQECLLSIVEGWRWGLRLAQITSDAILEWA